MAKRLNGLVVYVSGPITDDSHAAEKFAAAERKAAAAGALRVYSPLRALQLHRGRGHEQYMRHCLHELTRGDISTNATEYECLLLMDGWRESAGCITELVVAHALGLEVVELWEI